RIEVKGIGPHAWFESAVRAAMFSRARASSGSPIPAGSRQLVEQRLCFFQIGGVEALGEPAIHRGEQVAGFSTTALVAAEPGEAHGGAQFPELCILLPRDVEGVAIQFPLGLGMPSPQRQLAFVPMQLRSKPALPGTFGYLQGFL